MPPIPAPRAYLSRLRGGLVASALLAFLVGACIYLPGYVEGVPSDAPWMALPLRGWIAEGPARAEALAACFSADCALRVAVGVFAASVAEAETLAAIARDPQKLAHWLEARDAADRDPRRRAIRTVARALPLREGPLDGFSVALGRADGSRSAHGAVLGRGGGDGFRFVIAIGEDPETVRQVARDVAAAHLR